MGWPASLQRDPVWMRWVVSLRMTPKVAFQPPRAHSPAKHSFSLAWNHTPRNSCYGAHSFGRFGCVCSFVYPWACMQRPEEDVSGLAPVSLISLLAGKLTASATLSSQRAH